MVKVSFLNYSGATSGCHLINSLSHFSYNNKWVLQLYREVDTHAACIDIQIDDQLLNLKPIVV